MPTKLLPPLPFFAGFTAFTPEVPKLYWNVKSQEQRYFMLCKELYKMICYADTLAERINAIQGDLEQTIDDFKVEITAQLNQQNADIAAQLAQQNAYVAQQISTLKMYVDYRFDHMAEGMNVYDVTTGTYRPSDEAMRRLYSALAYNNTGMRALVSNLASNITVEALSNETCYYVAWSELDNIIINDQLPKGIS